MAWSRTSRHERGYAERSSSKVTDAPRSGSVDDAGFRRKYLEDGAGIVVKLDGAEQSKAYAYDCDKGYVWRLKTDDNGDYLLNDQRDEILRERVAGHVTAEIVGPIESPFRNLANEGDE